MASKNKGLLSPKVVFKDIQKFCLDKPEATEDYPWGEVVWKYHGKVFTFGGKDSARFTIKSTLDKQAALVMHPQINVAAYVGRFGWVTIEVKDEDTLQIAKDLIDESYESIARKKKTSGTRTRSR